MRLCHRGWKLAFSSFLIVVLQACGGGGGGGGSPARDNTTGNGKTLDEIISTYDSLRDSRYQGARGDAPLDASTILPFARAVLSEEFPRETASESSAVQTISQLTRQARHAVSRYPVISKRSKDQSSREKIDETEACDNRGGSVKITGTLDSNGDGALDYFYTQCQIEDLLLDGPVVVYLRNYETPEYFFYNDARLTVNGVVSALTGSIQFSGEPEVVTSNLVLRDVNSRYHYQVRNYREETAPVMGIPATQLKGEIYLPNLGKVDVEGHFIDAESENFRQGQLSISSNSVLVSVALNGYYSSVQRRDPATSDQPLYADIETRELLTYSGPDELIFRSRPEANQPPMYGVVRFVPEAPTEHDTIEVVINDIYDADGDSVEISYRWRVNGFELYGQTASMLPAGVAKAGDHVEALVELSDGQSTIGAYSWVSVAESTGQIVAVDLPSSINLGETLSVVIQYQQPGNSEPDSRVELVYGPAGAQINAEGELRWAPSELFFGRSQVFYFGFRLAGTADTPTEIAVTVNDPASPMPLIRSALRVPAANNSMDVMQFNVDEAAEILVSDTYSLVYTLQKFGDEYRQSWVYPYRLGTSSVVNAVPVNLDRRGADEIMVATQKEVLHIATPDSLAQLRYSVTGDVVIKDMVVADLNGDANDEIVLLLSSASNETGISYAVINAVSGALIREATLPVAANSMTVGNVDADAPLEIIFSSGLVYDGASGANQWFYGAGFGDLVVTADRNDDGVDEIFAAQTWGNLRLFSAQSRQLLNTLDGLNTCSLASGNIDADLQDELIAGGCQSGNLSAYDASGGSLQLQWQTEAIGYGSMSVFVGDADNDGINEVGWSSHQSSTGRDVFVIAETDPLSSNWVSQLQTDSFVGAGWGHVGDDDARGVFVVPRTDSGYEGQRVVLLSESGELQVSQELSSNWDLVSGASVVDFDRDGISELFLASAHWYDGFVQILQLSDFAQEWTSQTSGYSQDIVAIGSGDFNRDGRDDLVYSDSQRLVIVDVVNQSIIDTLSFGDRHVRDIAVVNLDEDQALELVVATDGVVSVWNQVGGVFSLTHETSAYCRRIVAGRVDAGAMWRIVCASDYYTSENGLYVFDTMLSQRQVLSVPYDISDLAVMGASSQQQTLLVAGNEDDHYSYQPAHSLVGAFSLEYGRLLWSSPQLVGQVPATSLRPFVDDAGRQRLLFSTGNAMYITR